MIYLSKIRVFLIGTYFEKDPYTTVPHQKLNRESTEGYSRRKVEKRHGKFGKTSLNNWSISKSKRGGRNQVSGRVSVPCRHATPVADALWKPIFGEISHSVKILSPIIMSQTGIMSNRYRFRWPQQVEKMQVQKEERPGIRRSKRSLVACHTRCRCFMETTRNSVKVNIGNKVIQLAEVWSVGESL